MFTISHFPILTLLLVPPALFTTIYLIRTFTLTLKYHSSRQKANCTPPIAYPNLDPLLGLDLFYRRIRDMNAGSSLSTDKQILSKYGKTVLTNSWGKKQYVIMDSANMQTVLATQVEKFGNEPMNYAMCAPFLGPGIITVDGPKWKASRNLLNPVFARSQVSDLSSFETHVMKFISILKQKDEVDVQPLCKALFLDRSTEFVFGKSANLLDDETGDSVARQLTRGFDEALMGMFTRYMLGPFKFLISGRKWMETCREVHGIIDGFIEEEFERQKSEAGEGKRENYVLLRELVKLTDDRMFIRNELMNIFFPARDTAGILTSNVLFLLARHPDAWQRLREEVLGIGGQEVTFELLKSLKYVHGVINETLRLQSPIGGSWKTCLEPCILPHGGGISGNDPILLQKGDEVRMSFYPLHTDPSIWGPDADSFRPERWIGLKQSWNFIPFMGGRRICPAQQNVLTDVAYVLVRLGREFKGLENRDGRVEYVDKIVFTRECRDGVKVAFVPDT